MYKRRKSLSQNFIKRSAVPRLVRNTSIDKNDLLIDIGAGTGIITRELAKRAKSVISVEIDRNLVDKLRTKFLNYDNVKVVEADFLRYQLPKHHYKIFANIPYSLTSVIINKLVWASNPPDDTYLIVQKEAAEKLTVNTSKTGNSQSAVLLAPFFEISITQALSRNDFVPRPGVDSVLLYIHKRSAALIPEPDREEYTKLVKFIYNNSSPTITRGVSKVFGKKRAIQILSELGIPKKGKPSQLSLGKWISLMRYHAKYAINSWV